MSAAPIRIAALPLLIAPLLALCPACGGDDAAPGPASASTSERASRANERRFLRAADPRTQELRRLVEAGEVEPARALLDELQERLGVEALLLGARLVALHGDAPAVKLEWGRLVERARQLAPEDPRVYATAAELHAATGAGETAGLEVRRGLAATGPAPEYDRAQGVRWISSQGGAAKGLEHLQRALADDPEIPFIRRPLSQAHLLLAKEALSERRLDVAALHASKARAFDAADLDVRRLEIDVQAARGDFAAAVAGLEALVAEGHDLAGELATMHKRAGVLALLERRRADAIASFAEARRRGLSDEELGTGARLLAEALEARLDAGIAAWNAKDLDGAAVELEAALALDPSSIEARHRLGALRFTQRDYAAAAAAWKKVVEAARAEELRLPEPVHIHLAKALFLEGDLEGARIVLEEYLDRAPFGDWVEETREQLALLPPQ